MLEAVFAVGVLNVVLQLVAVWQRERHYRLTKRQEDEVPWHPGVTRAAGRRDGATRR